MSQDPKSTSSTTQSRAKTSWWSCRSILPRPTATSTGAAIHNEGDQDPPHLDVPAAAAVAAAVNEVVRTEDHRPSAVEIKNHPTNATQCRVKVTCVNCARKRGIGCGTANCLCKNPPKEKKNESGTIPGTIADRRRLGTMPETTVTAVVVAHRHEEVHPVNGAKYPRLATCVNCATNSATGCPTAPISFRTSQFRTTCATSANK